MPDMEQKIHTQYIPEQLWGLMGKINIQVYLECRATNAFYKILEFTRKRLYEPSWTGFHRGGDGSTEPSVWAGPIQVMEGDLGRTFWNWCFCFLFWLRIQNIGSMSCLSWDAWDRKHYLLSFCNTYVFGLELTCDSKIAQGAFSIQQPCPQGLQRAWANSATHSPSDLHSQPIWGGLLPYFRMMKAALCSKKCSGPRAWCPCLESWSCHADILGDSCTSVKWVF